MSCRYLFVVGGYVPSCIYNVLLVPMHPLGLILYWKQKLSKGFRYFLMSEMNLMEQYTDCYGPGTV